MTVRRRTMKDKMVDKIQVKWCAELDQHIMPEDCLNDTEDCEMHCHLTDKYFIHNKENIGDITYDRSLPEDDAPTTYITIKKMHLISCRI